ncbi:hypothetical protein TrVE_jg5058 [Triparma verrucosa]|uniref:EF-hand domain-containing protein n=1 Tax=Triparma verrucosa TaxID=1606542 RepID=A0A9W7B272_9STRA|nr:hypothetical protein TrVE_jg5058 [Triparma verrucosa]
MLHTLTLSTRYWSFACYYFTSVVICLSSFYKHLKRNERKRVKARAKANEKLAVKRAKNSNRRLSVWERLNEEQPGLTEASPFVNPDWYFSKREYFKYCFLGPILVPIRITLILLFIMCGSVFGNLCMFNLKDKSKPLSTFRLLVRSPVKLFARLILFAMGFHYIPVTGRQAGKDKASVLVGNHVSFIETFYIGLLGASPVSKKENAEIPLFGALTSALQPILVDRLDPNSRKNVAKEICSRAQSKDWNQVVLFPEGTTTTGKALIQFKVGAFAPGEPVQPVLFFFGNNAFNFGMTSAGPSLHVLALRVLCQPNNNMSVHFMNPYNPSEEEKKDPKLYASNVRKLMATYMKVPTTEHSYDDVCLQIEALKVKRDDMSADASSMELKSLKKIVEIDKESAKELVKDFIRMDTNQSGRLDLSQFKKLFEGPFERTPVVDVEHLFHLLDRDDEGTIDLKEFVLGLALLNAEPTDSKDESVKLSFQVLEGGKGGGGIDMADLTTVLSQVYPEMGLDKIKAIVKEADADKNRVISLDEFLDMAERHQELALSGRGFWAKLF